MDKTELIKKVKIKLSRMEDWSGDWVHYSNLEIVNMNPKQFHQDPLGVYLFPKEFNTEGTNWKEKKFKYSVKFKGGKVLDFQDIDLKKAKEITSEMISDKKKRDVFLEEIDNSKNPRYQFYELVRQNFMGSPAKFNKALRDIGYSAVFDDTKTIHSSEVQLIVLDPSKLKVTGVEILKSGSGYKEVEEVTKKLKEFLKDYGSVSTEKTKKKKKGEDVFSRVIVEKDKKEAVWSVTTWFFRKVLQGVAIHLDYDTEGLFHERSWGGHVNESLDPKDALKDVKRAMDKIFKQ